MTKFLALFAGACLTITAHAADFDAQLKSRVEERKAELNQIVPGLLKTQKEVNRKNKLFKAKGKKDAGPILNPRVPWAGTKDNEANKKAYAQYLVALGDTSPKSLELPAELTEKLKLAGPDFLKKAKSFNLKDLDFTWITELKHYDFWEISENSPRVYLDKFSFTSAPVPDLMTVLAWAKLRLIKGVQEHNLPKASDEIQHLAKLVHSTETLLGAVTSLVMIRAASRAEELQHHHSLVDDEFVTGAKNYFLQFLNTASNPLIDAKFLTQLLETPGPGYCAVVSEAGEGILMSKPLLATDLKDVYVQFNAILKSSHACRWINLRKAWSGDLHYVLFWNSLPGASGADRKQALAALKGSLPEEDFASLNEDIANPRWPQHLGYVMALLKPHR